MYKYARLTCALALSAAALSAQSIPVTATAATTGMIGVADSETARLNLLNRGVQPPAVGVVCSANVMFVDGTGKVRKTGSLTIAPGTSQYIDLRSDADLAIVTAGDRIEIRAVVAVPFVPPPTAAGSTATTTSSPVLPAPCDLIATLEVFDTVNGRTLVSLGRLHVIPEPVLPPTPVSTTTP